jgi:hypothetical protein
MLLTKLSPSPKRIGDGLLRPEAKSWRSLLALRHAWPASNHPLVSADVRRWSLLLLLTLLLGWPTWTQMDSVRFAPVSVGEALLCLESSLADQCVDTSVDLLELVRGDVLSDHGDNGHRGTHSVLYQLAYRQCLAGRPIVRDRNFDYHDRFLSPVLGMRPPELNISLHEQGSRSPTSPSSVADTGSNSPASLCPVLPIGAENSPGKITAQGSAVAQQPTRRRRALDCDIARREDARHGGRATP